MTWFLFAGDMLVMLFMMALVVWMSMASSAETTRRSAHIPLEDEAPSPQPLARAAPGDFKR